MHGDLRRRIDEAVAQYEKAQRWLLRPDGKSRYSADEHEEFVRIAKSDFHAALDRVEGEIDARRERVEQRLQVEEHSDPSAALQGEELEEAGRRRPFIADEVTGRVVAPPDTKGAPVLGMFGA